MKTITKETAYRCTDGELFQNEFEAQKHQSKLDLQEILDRDTTMCCNMSYVDTGSVLEFLKKHPVEVFDYIIFRNAELRNAMKRNK